MTWSLTPSTSARVVESVSDTLRITSRSCGATAPAEPAESLVGRPGGTALRAAVELPPELEDRSSPPPDRKATPMISTSTAITEAAAPAARIPPRNDSQRCRRGGFRKPSATRRSIRSVQRGWGAGRVSRTKASRSNWSGIEGLPELGHGAVHERAGVRDADSEHGGELGVGELGVVLE